MTVAEIDGCVLEPAVEGRAQAFGQIDPIVHAVTRLQNARFHGAAGDRAQTLIELSTVIDTVARRQNVVLESPVADHPHALDEQIRSLLTSTGSERVGLECSPDDVDKTTVTLRRVVDAHTLSTSIWIDRGESITGEQRQGNNDECFQHGRTPYRAITGTNDMHSASPQGQSIKISNSAGIANDVAGHSSAVSRPV